MSKTKMAKVDRRSKFPRLYAWLRAACRHGAVYYRCDVSRSGMQAKVLLWTIARGPSGKMEPVVAWPDDGASVCGFSVRRRSFVVGGCGFNRPLHALDAVASFFGMHDVQARVRLDSLNTPE